MIPGKVVITGLIVVALFAGCLKKKAESDKGSASDTVAATTPNAAQSQDIFDEFYKADSTAPTKSESKASKKKTVERSASAASGSFVEGGRYVVQVAQATSDKLSAKGYPSYIAEVQNPTPALAGTYYRVRIGGFSSTSSARAFGDQSLASDGYEFWVDNRSNDNIGLSGSGLGSGSSSSYGSEPAPAAASEYQSSYQSAPAPAPEPAVQSAPQPAPAVSTPAAAPAAPAPAPTGSSSTTKSEWGNDGW
jgi:hypothetical protein